MRTRHARLAATALAVLAVCAAVPATASFRLPDQGLVRLPSGSSLTLAGGVDLGRADPNAPFTVSISLAHANPLGEARAAEEVNDPTSSSYRKFFTPDTWQSTFGPTPSTQNEVREWLTRYGLDVAWSSYDYMIVHGRTREVEKTFSIDLHQFQTADGRRVTASEDAPLVPAAISATRGLAGAPEPTTSMSHQTSCAGGTCVGVLSPKDLWSAYDQPERARGRGQRIGIVGAGSYLPSIADLREFQRVNKLPKTNIRVVNINDDQSTTVFNDEWSLDLQAATAMAPDVDELVLYFGSQLSDSPAALSAWVNDPDGPNQVTSSVGGCEALIVGLGEIDATEPILKQAVAEGRTFFNSTGDTGGSCSGALGVNGVTNSVVPQVSYPASSSYALAVGGTVLYTDPATSKRSFERAWEYTGGGSSVIFPEPTWQQRIPVIVGRCGLEGNGGPGNPAQVCKGVPDVTAVSGDLATDGFGIIVNGKPAVGGGTSLSSPLWAGMWARLQSTKPSTGTKASTVGFAAPLLYARAQESTFNSPDFFDITVGSNGQYTALPATSTNPTGWDYVSGLGAPDVGNLMRHVTHQTRSGNHSVVSSPGAGAMTVVFGAPRKVPLRPCAGASVVRDARGDSGSLGGDVDIERTTVNATPHTLSFVVSLPSLVNDPHLVLVKVDFEYEGAAYAVLGERDLDALNQYTFEVEKFVPNATHYKGVVQGAFDYAKHEVRLAFDTRRFNETVAPPRPLEPSGLLHVTGTSTNADLNFTDTAAAGDCLLPLR